MYRIIFILPFAFIGYRLMTAENLEREIVILSILFATAFVFIILLKVIADLYYASFVKEEEEKQKNK